MVTLYGWQESQPRATRLRGAMLHAQEALGCNEDTSGHRMLVRRLEPFVGLAPNPSRDLQFQGLRFYRPL